MSHHASHRSRAPDLNHAALHRPGELPLSAYTLKRPADVVVADVIQLFLVLALDRLTLAVDDRVRRNDAELAVPERRVRVHAHDLELHGAEPSTDQEAVPLAGGTVRLHVVPQNRSTMHESE